MRSVLDSPRDSYTKAFFQQTSDVAGQIEVRLVEQRRFAEWSPVIRRGYLSDSRRREEPLWPQIPPEEDIIIDVDVVLTQIGNVVQSGDDRVAVRTEDCVVVGP